MAFLHELFFLVCGSNHVWILGGTPLPFCQRCTGLYVGAILALAVVATYRPRPTSPVLWFHGWLLLLMAPFGFHWVNQTGMMRTLTGGLFAFGLVYFLLLNLVAVSGVRLGDKWGGLRAYVLCILPVLAGLQMTVFAGGTSTGVLLSWIGFAGLVLYAVLALANLVILPPVVWRLFRPVPGSTP